MFKSAVGLRRKTVGTIEKITGTMKLVAQAQLLGTIKKAKDHAGFFLNVKAMLDKFPEATPAEGKPEKIISMMITSNRGLCGSLNSQLIRDTVRMPEAAGDSPFFVLGDKGATVRPIFLEFCPLCGAWLFFFFFFFFSFLKATFLSILTIDQPSTLLCSLLS